MNTDTNVRGEAGTAEVALGMLATNHAKGRVLTKVLGYFLFLESVL